MLIYSMEHKKFIEFPSWAHIIVIFTLYFRATLPTWSLNKFENGYEYVGARNKWSGILMKLATVTEYEVYKY